MNVKSGMLSIVFLGLCAACSNDNGPGENGSSLTPGGTTGNGNEVQLMFSGSGQSAEYETKAIASDLENQIDNLDVYVFASDLPDGTYYYLETWKMAATDDKTTKTFSLQDLSTGKKASIYPGELVGLPYLKLYCVANPQDALYEKDGTTAVALKAVTAYDADARTATPADASVETGFLQTFAKTLDGADAAGGNPIKTPLVMTGNGITKISGTVSKVDIELKRVVARFDIENNTQTSQLTIENITMANARKNGGLFTDLDATVDKVEEADFATGLMTYNDKDFSTVDKNNQGLAEGALYVYPNLTTDQGYLIIKGKFKSPIDGSQVPVTYHVPIVKQDPLTPDQPSPYIAIKRNSRYKLRIVDVTNSNIYGTFEVEDWTSGGGVVVKPDNDAPAFTGAADLEAVTGAVPEQDATDKSLYKLTDDAGSFKMKLRASGRIVADVVQTKADASWLSISGYEYADDVETPGLIVTTVTFNYTDATGQLPCRVTFRNDAASYDPDLWTVLTFAGPYATPTLVANAGGHSLGNTVDLASAPAAPTASMYKVNGSEIKLDVTCIDGVAVTVPTGFTATAGETQNYVTPYSIKITDASAVAEGNPVITFKNAKSDAGKALINVTVTLKGAGMTADLAANATGKAEISGSAAAYTVKTDLDLLGAENYTLQIHAPEGVTAELPTGKWLTVTEVPFANGVAAYTIAKAAGIDVTTDFDIVFTNKLDATDKLTVTMNKAYSKPKLAAATVATSDAFNTVTVASDYEATSNMYIAQDSKIYIKATCGNSETVACKNPPAGLSVTDADGDGEWEVKVIDPTQLTAGGTSEIVFENSADATRSAKLTVTWKSAAISITLTANDYVAESTEGDNIVYTVDIVNLNNFVFTVTAPGGATTDLSVISGTFLKAHTSNTGDNDITAGTPESYMFRTDDDTQTADITMTITNKVTNGGNKTIIFRKKS